MIELDKQEAPTQQELQDYVNHVYDYAVDLYTNQKMGWEEIKEELIKQGINPEGASTVVENLQEQEKEAKLKVANKEVVFGIMWIIGGLVLTAITDVTYIFWGAVVWGICLVLKGSNHKWDKN